MARRKRSKTSKRQSGFANMLVFLVMIFVCIFLAQKIVSLNAKSKDLAQQEALLEREIAQARVEFDNLVAQEQYMQTTAYIEDVAKDKLGLVYPDEIVIKPAE